MSNVFVGGLNYSLSEDDLRNAFSDCGNITSCKIITDRNTGRSRGYGFIEFETSEAAKKAKEKNDTVLSGRTIVVNDAVKK